MGPVQDNPWLFFLLTFGLAIIGGLLFIIPKFSETVGIKNNGIYHNSLTRGLTSKPRLGYLMVAIFGIIIFGFLKLQNAFWPIVTLVIAGLISYLVFYRENSKENTPARSASPVDLGWLGIIAGTYLIGFYILLYWAPAYINNWIVMVSPISESLSGNAASNWFLYGLMYSIIVVVMGIRMISKYRHNKYQQVRTLSVMFFQTAFAFLIPEILVRLNQPWFDFKNIWPLDYDFFFKYNLEELTSSGSLGIFMLGWGILLILIGVPVITYFFGKRWYCSWVCGCGGLAETMGDPFRQLSDKSLRAWKYERFIIHGVLLAAVIMTILVLYHYFTGSNTLLGLNSDNVKSWYGFLIGAGFSGVVGTGFYPIMGNRVWCRFGCPLAAYLGLVQKFKSRFRITTNGGQCISCGNCSTYCEMGIDVRSYAQRGQDIIRSSCVGCGVCAAVCPRGVLRLENADGDILDRGEVLRTVHITEDEIKILN
ncbi:MAG: 4Fe-4S binding protein [Bacteroidia bacterium]|nr:4Fe-4S binding protein [Bacteroidia bacterium]